MDANWTLRGYDSAPDLADALLGAEGGKVRNAKVSRRDAYIARITCILPDNEPLEPDQEDEERKPDEEEPEKPTGADALDGRDHYVRWLAEYQP